LSENSYVKKITKWVKITGKIKAIKQSVCMGV